MIQNRTPQMRNYELRTTSLYAQYLITVINNIEHTSEYTFDSLLVHPNFASDTRC